jgi:hypothetical protein
MNQEKYIGMDVHAATISAAVRNAEGKLLIDPVVSYRCRAAVESVVADLEINVAGMTARRTHNPPAAISPHENIG